MHLHVLQNSGIDPSLRKQATVKFDRLQETLRKPPALLLPSSPLSLHLQLRMNSAKSTSLSAVSPSTRTAFTFPCMAAVLRTNAPYPNPRQSVRQAIGKRITHFLSPMCSSLWNHCKTSCPFNSFTNCMRCRTPVNELNTLSIVSLSQSMSIAEAVAAKIFSKLC